MDNTINKDLEFSAHRNCQPGSGVVNHSIKKTNI